MSDQRLTIDLKHMIDIQHTLAFSELKLLIAIFARMDKETNTIKRDEMGDIHEDAGLADTTVQPALTRILIKIEKTGLFRRLSKNEYEVSKELARYEGFVTDSSSGKETLTEKMERLGVEGVTVDPPKSLTQVELDLLVLLAKHMHRQRNTIYLPIFRDDICQMAGITKGFLRILIGNLINKRVISWRGEDTYAIDNRVAYYVPTFKMRIA